MTTMQELAKTSKLLYNFQEEVIAAAVCCPRCKVTWAGVAGLSTTAIQCPKCGYQEDFDWTSLLPDNLRKSVIIKECGDCNETWKMLGQEFDTCPECFHPLKTI